jgi:hypothetical protein
MPSLGHILAATPQPVFQNLHPVAVQAELHCRFSPIHGLLISVAREHSELAVQACLVANFPRAILFSGSAS